MEDIMEQLAKALASAQAEFGTVPQSGMNPFHKSKYSTIEDYVNAAKPTLAKHGLSISQAPNLMDGQFVLTTILMHESGEHLASNQPIFATSFILFIAPESGCSCVIVTLTHINYPFVSSVLRLLKRASTSLRLASSIASISPFNPS